MNDQGGDASDDNDGVREPWDGNAEAFSLDAPDAPVAKGKPRGRRSAKAGAAPELTHYSHADKRLNNPDVGIVNATTDPDQPAKRWAYDPHIDPALQFDSQRSAIETLIDDALASGDTEIMRGALAELKKRQAPYLNWAGKAERTSFEVDTVSLHVHERIDPATILAAIRKQVAETSTGVGEGAQPWLFDPPFEALPLRQALDFYGHEKGWANRLVAGDSLLVMNSLLQKESMAGQVQMIYFDPPYGIKYGSNFQPFTSKRDVTDGSDADLTQEPEMIKAFRDTWELGIHSYLTYIRDRLLLSRELLHETGSIFVQISNENLHHVQELMSEVFGAENVVSLISFTKTTGLGTDGLADRCDYLLWYAKKKEILKFRQPFEIKRPGEDGAQQYEWLESETGERRKIKNFSEIDGSERVFNHGDIRSFLTTPHLALDFEYLGEKFSPGSSNQWKTTQDGLKRLAIANRLMALGKTLRYIRYLDDFPVFPQTSLWTDTGISGYSDPKVYAVQTSPKVIERCVLMTTDPGDLVFDPTCGSGTTSVVAEKWGRRWITCDTSRVAITLAKTRLMTSGFDYFRIRYPAEGLKGGFDYQTVPHIMLKAVANNPDIDMIFEAKHPAVAAALEVLNAALVTNPPQALRPVHGRRKGKAIAFSSGDALDEWEVPFEIPVDWPEAARAPFETFHAARRAMQEDIDRSIAVHADLETLYDKPERDPSKLRVTGPFTVEAVPSPIVASLDREPPAADASIARSGETARQSSWRDELLKTGIRGKGGQMLHIAGLEVIPGCKHLHASGALADEGSRVVVSFGPEHAALEQRQVERALEEAGKLMPPPRLVVFCAFTFDPEAAKDIDEIQWPGVTLLKAQMNTDLLTEDLKKARSSNQSFWLMGQPDVDVTKVDGRWQVQVNGFDYFDTKSGELVSGGTKNIAMWSLDTDYDGRAVFPRQTFFPMAGAKDGWNRLKANIKAELDADLLDRFHGVASLPFDAGEHRRIAVKIVDDRGIESLKIVSLDD